MAPAATYIVCCVYADAYAVLMGRQWRNAQKQGAAAEQAPLVAGAGNSYVSAAQVTASSVSNP